MIFYRSLILSMIDSGSELNMPKLARVFIGIVAGLLAGAVVGRVAPLAFGMVIGAIKHDSSDSGAAFFLILTLPVGAIYGASLGLAWALGDRKRK
jgi:hypothetical protein